MVIALAEEKLSYSAEDIVGVDDETIDAVTTFMSCFLK